MRVLAFAYACEPGKGSEPGAGWLLARMIGQFADVIVITRANNREAIEEALPAVSVRNRLDFRYVDLPAWARTWKKGKRGARLYYLLWQWAALREARSLSRGANFDCVWHLTLANVWLGSSAALIKAPFVYGPIGGGVRPPFRLTLSLGVRSVLYEMGRSLIRWLARYLNPLARVAWRRADLILVQNPETSQWLPRAHRHKARTFQNAVVEEALPQRTRADLENPTACFAGRLVAWKGPALAIEAIGVTSAWRLLVCGDGPQAVSLRELAAPLGDRVMFLGHLTQSQLHDVLSERVDVFLYPSLHDDSPLAVAEAVACRLPVVCLDRGGPPLIVRDAGVVVSSTGDREAVVRRLANALDDALALTPLPEREATRVLSGERAEELRLLLSEAGIEAA